MINEPIEVTKEEADQIIIDWNKGNNPHRPVVCVWRGQWYDLRPLKTAQELSEFMASLTGVTPTAENTMNIHIK